MRLNFTRKDKMICATLYRHRFLSVKMLYKLLFEKQGGFRYQSLVDRLNKLEKHRVLKGSYYFPDGVEVDPKMRAQKCYQLNYLGVYKALDFLSDEPNVVDVGVEDNIYDESNLLVRTRQTHHMLTQDVVVNSLFRLLDTYDSIFDIRYFDGRQFVLPFNDKEKETFLRPDWAFVQKDRVIVLETDRATERHEMINEKLKKYKAHLEQNKSDYVNNPLVVVIAVEMSGSQSKNRIRNIKKYAHDIFRGDLLRHNLINFYVLALDDAHNVIVNELTEDHSLLDLKMFKEQFIPIVRRDKGFSYVDMNMEAKDERHDGLLFANHDSSMKYEVYVVDMRQGDLFGEDLLMRIEDAINEENDGEGIGIGYYRNKEELINDVFMDYYGEVTTEDNIVVKKHFSIGDRIFFTYPGFLEKGFLYQLHRKDSRTRMKVVSVEDAVR